MLQAWLAKPFQNLNQGSLWPSQRKWTCSFLADLTASCQVLPKHLPASQSHSSQQFFPSPPDSSFQSNLWSCHSLDQNLSVPSCCLLASWAQRWPGMRAWVLCVPALISWMGPGLSSLCALRFGLPFCGNMFLRLHVPDPHPCPLPSYPLSQRFHLWSNFQLFPSSVSKFYWWVPSTEALHFSRLSWSSIPYSLFSFPHKITAPSRAGLCLTHPPVALR